ncbi:MAG: bifunctional DNA-binding transcriptional regulator/O6-methylguanine-DNA methyltransferase Ada [Planctomycetes bacterium]|nr:bifunctional DNA-binding transcriptional regulator/O6-methylguanine-DNA methyltransferase Ada [Planctomycetota bacterium]
MTISTTPASPLAPVCDDEAWSAVLARDALLDGRFVYAVRTTNVFCRPSCPARRPNRENVRFFASPLDARRSGYRACRRCRPDDEAGTAAEQAVERARAYLASKPNERVTLADLARVCEMSPAHLQRTFKRLIGVTPRRYHQALRVEAFRADSRAGRSVLDAGFHAGFGSSRALYEQAGDALGMTPGAYRRGGAGVAIAYATGVTSIGVVLVAVTARGVCAAFIGDDASQVERELRAEFPAADCQRDEAELSDVLDAFIAMIDSDVATTPPPVDLVGTDFQRSVWDAIRAIPRGERRTYAELAAAIGRPASARAVAGACAANRVAVAVPCHRVIRGDGGLGGYRWGEPRKRALLSRETTDRS